MNTHILDIENVSKKFYPDLRLREIFTFNFKKKNPVQALDDISFSLVKGKILGILGPNGAGKTTLLKIISTLILPDKGSVKINNHQVGIDDEKIKSIIGLVTPEERSFYWRLSGMQNLEFFASLYNIDKNSFSKKVKELFQIFNINYEHKRFDSYSTGMKRKFSLIRALMHDPELLLLDEPTKSLDYNSSVELINFIQKIKAKGTTIILATHDIKIAEDICDDFLILSKGKVIAQGAKQELINKTQKQAKNLTDIYLELSENNV